MVGGEEGGGGEGFSSRCAEAVGVFSPGAWRTSEVGVAR